MADRFHHPPSYTICDAVVSSPTVSQAVCLQFFSHLTSFLSLSPPHTSGKACATCVLFLAQSLLFIPHFPPTSLLSPPLSSLLSPPFYSSLLPHTAVFEVMTQQQQWTFASLPPHSLPLYSMVHTFLLSVYLTITTVGTLQISEHMDSSNAVKLIQQLSDREQVSVLHCETCVSLILPSLSAQLAVSLEHHCLSAEH